MCKSDNDKRIEKLKNNALNFNYSPSRCRSRYVLDGSFTTRNLIYLIATPFVIHKMYAEEKNSKQFKNNKFLQQTMLANANFSTLHSFTFINSLYTFNLFVRYPTNSAASSVNLMKKYDRELQQFLNLLKF